ncbi:MAG: hypothetical protein L0Z70_09235 [Chloroflexi bacterium]|nr:hypothetical protein [Chloroflexota bacterium]
MNLFDQAVLLLTGLAAIYLLWRFYGRYAKTKKLHDLYYMLGFAVLLVSGLLLIFLGYGILASPYVLTVASLIPLGISLGVANQYFPSWKKAFAWFALVGFLAIAITSIGGMSLKKLAVPLFHGVAGLVIFLGPFLAKGAPKGFWWVGVGGVLIGLGGIALAFLSVGSQLLFFSQSFVLMILAPLLLLMTLAFAWGFVKDING